MKTEVFKPLKPDLHPEEAGPRLEARRRRLATQLLAGLPVFPKL